jgi:hypothetical protein
MIDQLNGLLGTQIETYGTTWNATRVARDTKSMS